MTAFADEAISYPLMEDDALDVDPAYTELQRRGPIRVQLAIGEPCWLATRHRDVRTIYTDRRFSRRLRPGIDPPGVWPGAGKIEPTFPLGMDPPEHTRLRRITAPVFSPRSVRTMTERIQGHVDELLDRVADCGVGADFVELYTWDLPIRVLTDMLGVPLSDADDFRVWVDAASDLRIADNDRIEPSRRIYAYIETLITERRRSRHDDLLGLLVDARDEGERLSEPELRDVCMSLIFGGFKTAAAQLGSTVYALMTHPDRWLELVEARTELRPALEELWRWIPSFHYATPFVRWAKEDVELSGGVVIRAGEFIVPEQSVANRDEAAYPNAREMDFHRVEPPPHLALGFGEHLCMGIHLAKIQLELTVATLARRFPTLELAVAPEEIRWPRRTFMRAAESLPLAW